MTVLFFVLGLIVLLGGAHLLVSSSSSIALRLGIPSLFIGITVVAFATSAPEIAVSLSALFGEQAGMALGNVIGSNIANILLILGMSALIAPVSIQRRVVWQDVPIMVMASVVIYLLSLDRVLQPADGVILLVLFAGFMAFQIYQARRDYKSAARERENEQRPAGGKPVWVHGVILLCGFGLLILGAHWMVDSGVQIARNFGLSELVIGLTIIAIGTSLPELATSLLAARNNQADLSVGNVIGSNIFNILLILGITALFSGEGMEISNAALALDLPFMVAVSVACLPLFFSRHSIARWEGGVFLGYYAAYLLYLFLDTTQHQMLPLFNNVMALFVIPITVLTLVILVARAINRSQKRSTEEPQNAK